MTTWLIILATMAAMLGGEWLVMRWLGLHVCDEPKDHPPRAFEVENPDADGDPELAGL